MIRKMFEWSNRLSCRSTFGDQLPRWYSALVPNSSAALIAKTALATVSAVPLESAISKIPATTEKGNVPACSQPPSDSCQLTVVALRTRTRKVAWKASSAAW